MTTFIKTLTIDGFYSTENAKALFNVVRGLRDFQTNDLGEQLNNFNMIPEDATEIFSRTLGFPVTVDLDRSGIFKKPDSFVHFEDFDSPREWIFLVAIDRAIVDIYEHNSGVEHALQGYQFNYRNIFEWDHYVNYHLKPGQGIFFRPWLFHSVNGSLIQTFRLSESCQ